MITLHLKSCLNTRLRAVNCTRCADACPAEGTITVVDGRPALNNAACLDCGLCLHLCPTGAFSQPDILTGKLVKTVAALPPGPVDLICPQNPTPNHGPAPQAVQMKRCLAALSSAALLELSTHKREIWLDDTYCASCPLGKVHNTLIDSISEANSWRSLLEEAGPISLRTRQTKAPEASSRPVYDLDRPSISRRRLLGVFKQLGQAAVIPATRTEMIKAGKSVPVSERLPYNVPRQRAKILSIIEQKSLNTSRSSPVIDNQFTSSKSSFSIIDLNLDPDRCAACGLCARFCPTGALKFLSDGKEFGVTFQPSLCLGKVCNACEIACPEQAITTRPAAISPAVLIKKPLVAGELAPCRSCRQPIANRPGLPATCFACRSNGPLNDLLKSLPFHPKNEP